MVNEQFNELAEKTLLCSDQQPANPSGNKARWWHKRVAGDSSAVSGADQSGTAAFAASAQALPEKQPNLFAVLATFGVLGAAYLPLLQQYALESRCAGSAAYAAIATVIFSLLLYRAWRDVAEGSNGLRAVCSLLAAMLVLALALVTAQPWLAVVSAWLAVAAVLDWSGGAQLLCASWQLLLAGSLSLLLPTSFVSAVTRQASHDLPYAARAMLELCGVVCLIDGDVLELYRGRVDPGQAYFGLNLVVAVAAGCLVLAHLRRRGPVFSMLLVAAGLVWLWLICAVQLLVFGLVIEGDLPLANAPATLVPITVGATLALMVLIVSADCTLEFFLRLLFGFAGAASPAAATPITELSTQPAIAAVAFDTSGMARLLWRGLLLLSCAIGVEQWEFDRSYWVASQRPAEIAEDLICDRSLLPERWGERRCVSFHRLRDASCLGKTAILPTWRYDAPDEAVTVCLSLTRRTWSDGLKDNAFSDTPAAGSSRSASSDADPPGTALAWPKVKVESQREATLLTLAAPLALTKDVEPGQPNDYLAAYSPPALTAWLAPLRRLGDRPPVCLSMLLTAYHDLDVAEDSQAQVLFRTVLAAARAARERSEVLP